MSLHSQLVTPMAFGIVTAWWGMVLLGYPLCSPFTCAKTLKSFQGPSLHICLRSPGTSRRGLLEVRTPSFGPARGIGRPRPTHVNHGTAAACQLLSNVL
jgi:hypothetical protein